MENLAQRSFAALSLSVEDKQKLLDQRGLVEETCQILGFKSSARANREILVSRSAKYSMKALLEAGLYLQSDKGDHPYPKFFGWGEKGKKRLPTGEKAPEMDWVYPVLIPYFNRHGELEHLRPHRDMSKGVSPRLYVVRRVGESTQENHKTVVVTEGEFKAAALKQVLFGIAPTRSRKPWTASADGQRFLIKVPVNRTNDSSITVVLNWMEELKKKQ